MLLTVNTFYILCAFIALPTGGLVFWLTLKIKDLPLGGRVFAAFLAACIGPILMMEYKTSVIVIENDFTTRHVLIGEAEFEFANGEKEKISYLNHGECIINNTLDSCAIERIEYGGGYEEVEGSKLSSILMLAAPMRTTYFSGAEIGYLFQDPPQYIKMRTKSENATSTSFLLRNLNASDYLDYDIYDGKIADGKPNGKGTLWFNKMYQYTGDFVNGMYEGKGVISFQNGARYEGDFVNDFIHGNGVYYFSDSSVYEGAWVNAYMEGYGRLNYPNGDYYEGNFVQDLFDGQGKMVYLSSGKTEEGIWREGVLQE